MMLLSGASDHLLFNSPPGNSPLYFSSEQAIQRSGSVCFFDVDGSYLTATSLNCPGGSNGSIVFNTQGLIGGTPPFTYDWDDVGTSGNDPYPGDGTSTATTLNSIPAGLYQLIVTDDAGCVASSTKQVIAAPPFVVTTEIDSITGCETSGGILINTYSGPAGIVIYNWDLASTTFDDDYGPGAVNYGLPPEEDDAQDLVTNSLNGTYYLTITVSNNPINPAYECIYLDTFIINGGGTVTEICPLGEISFYAGTSNPALTYQWQVDSVGSFINLNNGLNYAGTTTPTLMIMDALSSWYGHKYRAKMMQGGNTTYSQVYTLKFRMCWTGAVDFAWENANNWNCVMVLNAYTDVYINSGLPLYPMINSNRSCRSVRLQSGATLTVKVPNKLLLLGEE